MKNEYTLVMGRHPVIEALKAHQPFNRVFLQQGVRGPYESEVRQLCKANTVPLQIIPKERFHKFTRANHQGVLGLLSPVPYQRLEDILPLVYEQSKNPLFVLLDGVTDTRNFGAIARSAELCGAQAVVLPLKNSVQITPDSIKTSAGALLTLPVCREKNLLDAIKFLQMSGVTVFGSSLRTAHMVSEVDFTGPTAIVLGSEERGISREVTALVDQPFKLPQVGQTDSFNVSVAAGIILYEVLRQRGR